MALTHTDDSLMSWIIVLFILNSLITKDSFIAEKLETIFILPLFSPTHEITYTVGNLQLLTTDDEYSMHHDLGINVLLVHFGYFS